MGSSLGWENNNRWQWSVVVLSVKLKEEKIANKERCFFFFSKKKNSTRRLEHFFFNNR
jgi:hypothetical protein